MNVALVAGLVLTSLLAGCEAQGTKGQGMVFPPSPGTKGGGYFPEGGGFGGGFGGGARGGMKGGGFKGFPQQQQQPQQQQFPPLMSPQQQYPMGGPQRPMYQGPSFG
ncbi:uncharacterized protein [Dermacentor andersoni]|uniref:uncharacterized protein n=1 Tax=Dermacentor andersoni TaxID=34620 RepID=UPI002416BACA|nr:acanthoscurrin-1-like [Dermacentor andersoni]